MNNFDNVQFDVKSIPIISLIEKETGQSFKKYTLDKCPFCASGSGKKSTPGFSVKTQDNIFKCFACGKKGSTIEFIQYFKNISDSKEAIKYLLKNYSNMPIVTNEPIKKDTDSFSKMVYAIKNNEISKASSYLVSRKIEVDKISKGSYYYDSKDNAIVFIDSLEKLINKRFISPGEKNISHKNASGSTILNAIYDKTFLPGNNTVIISEKPIDALSMYCYGYSAISVFSATGLINDKEKLSNYINDKNVILSFDNDNAGNNAITYYKDYILNNFQVTSLKQILYSEKTDANDLLKKGLLEKFLNDPENYTILKPDFLNEPVTEMKPDPQGERIVYSKNHKYYKTETKGGKTYQSVISNYDMQLMYHLQDGSEDSNRLVKFQRYTGEIIFTEILSSKISGEKFKTILRSMGDRGFSFTGFSNDHESILTYLYDFEKNAIPLTNPGYYPEHEIFSFSNAVVNQNNEILKPNEIGILTDRNKCFYISTASEVIKRDKTPDFTYKEGNISFNDYAELIYKSYGVDGIIGLCFFINSLFRDFIFTVTGRFPFLYLYGEPGTGKTSFIDILRSPYNNKNDLGHALNTSTHKALGRVIAQHENYIVYFKEYSNNINPEILELLKTCYDGASYSRAKKSNDNSIVDGNCKSAVILDGNSLPTYEAAIYDRIILLDFDSAKFTNEQKEAYSKLKNEIAIGTSQIIKEIIKHRKTFTSKFKETYNKIYSDIKHSDKEYNGSKINEISTRTIEHTAFLLATYKIFSTVFKFPLNYAEISTKIIDYAIEKELTINTIKPISVFWNAINYNLTLAYSPITKENLRIDETYLYLKIENLYTFYVKYCKENGKKYEDQTGLKRLLCSKNNPSFVPGNRNEKGNNAVCHTLRNFGSCYRFTYEKNEDQILVNNSEVNIKFDFYSNKSM